MDFLRESVYPAINLKSQKYPKRPVTPMSCTKTNKINHKRRTDPREVRSWSTGVNPSSHSRTLLYHRLQRITSDDPFSSKGPPGTDLRSMEKNFRPQWFITFLWNYLPTWSETVISHSRHFTNAFFTSLLNQLLKKLPEPPLRSQLVFSHERKLVITRGRQITACHTHLHMVALPDSLNHLWYLDHLIHQKVSPRV